MCGIAGIVRTRDGPVPDRDRLIRMRDHMIRRGPDDAGEWSDDHGMVRLGHRRLSIIDTSAAGHQPMLSSFGPHAITFNGEIYNYRALRSELEDQGYRFHSASDTEVLLALYHRHGDDMFGHLRGMYALGLWDADRRSLLLARDPYGIKPLYYCSDGRSLAFASQVRALVAGGGIGAEVNPAAEAGFLLTGSVPEPHTWFRDIRCLPAGGRLWVENGVVGPVRFHADVRSDLAMAAPEHRMPEEKSALVREALVDSVRHHLVSDVPVGIFLSAGIDSSALAGLATEVLDTPPVTVTLGFDEYSGRPDDERPLAQVVSRHYGTRHHQRRVGREEFEADLPAILDAMDQPTIDGINTWFVSKAAAELGLKVMLSGIGGDELFGGYPSFADIPRWKRRWGWMSRVPGLADLAWSARRLDPLGVIPPKAWALPQYAGTYAGGYLLRRGLFLPRDLPGLMTRERLVEAEALLDVPAWFSVEGRSLHGRIAAMESAFYLRNQLLRDTDWSSMAHSVEVRTPLVDRDLTRALAGVLAAGAGKRLIATSPRPGLPAPLLDRARSGFTTPIAGWMQSCRLPGAKAPMAGPARGGHWARPYALALREFWVAS